MTDREFEVRAPAMLTMSYGKVRKESTSLVGYVTAWPSPAAIIAAADTRLGSMPKRHCSLMPLCSVLMRIASASWPACAANWKRPAMRPRLKWIFSCAWMPCRHIGDHAANGTTSGL